MDLPGFSLELSSLKESAQPSADLTYDLLVLGGGPAAMSAAIYAARKLLKVALVSEDYGGQVRDTSNIENYIGFQTVTGQELVQKFLEHVKSFAVPLAEGQRVTRVAQSAGKFQVLTASGTTFCGKTVILATGKHYRKLGVPGEQELTGRGVAYCAICDAPFFKGQRVVVAGGGNSAFTAALDLLKVSAEVTLVNFVEGWQADPILQQAVGRYPRLTLLDRHAVVAVEGQDKVQGVRVRDRQSAQERTLAADGLFVEIGLVPNTDPVAELAQLDTSRQLVVDCHCRTNIPGLFGAGDATTVPYNQIVISAGEGAKAALAAYDLLVQTGQL